MSTLAETFGKHLCFARLEKGWTQMELAAKSGVGQSCISKCETGAAEPRLFHALALAAALGTSVEALAGEVTR